MRHFKYIIFSLLLTLGFVGCNQENNDFDIEYASIHPMGGQYSVTVKDELGNKVNTATLYCYLANTTDNSTTKCWLRIGSYSTSATTAYSINGKIDCDLTSLSFSGSNIMNLAGNVTTSSETFNVTGGKIELNGITAPSGTITDKISFTFTRTLKPGKTYTVVGFRYTGWPEDL
ncbi:MAG TPA: lipid-binding protein [Prolixibacteraceae bacterium]|nr:lipid-binding protein [Prolixibacteraceae bacterium]